MTTAVQNTITVSSAAELMAALANAVGGEIILLTAGSYGELDLYDQRQTFANFASEVTIKSADPDNLASFQRMSLAGVENLTFDTIKFDYEAAPGTPDYDKPFLIRDSSSITIRNSVFDGDIAEGLGTSADGYGTGHGLTVTNSSDIAVESTEFYNWMRAAVFTGVNNLVVAGNDVHKVRSDGLDFANVDNVLIEGNYIHDFRGAEGTGDHMDMIQFWTNGTTSPSTNITIRQNVLDSGAGNYTQSIFMRNEVVDSFGGGVEMYYQNVLIEDNVIYNAHAHGVTVGETIGLTIQNNTILHNQDSSDNGLVSIPTINVNNLSQDVVIANNILPRLSILSAEGRVVENNLVVQRSHPDGDNYVGDLFTNALADSRATLSDVKAVPGGLIEQSGVGSSLTRFDTTPDSPTGFITNDAGSGLELLTHSLDASSLFGPSGALDLSGAKVIWDFGDGTSGGDLVMSHTWQHAGTYNVIAKVTLSDGQTVSLSKTVEVNSPLAIHANFDTGAHDLSDVSNGLLAGSLATFEGADSDLALRLNGDRVGYQRNAELINNTEYTLQVDFKKEAGSEGASGTAVYFSSSFVVHIGADSLNVMVGTDQGSTWLKPTSVGINDADWHRLALTFSSEDGTAILYLDGVEVGRLSGLQGAVQVGSTSHDFYVGHPSGGTSSFPGLIDNVQFWRGAMTAEQVSALATRGADGKFAPLAEPTASDTTETDTTTTDTTTTDTTTTDTTATDTTATDTTATDTTATDTTATDTTATDTTATEPTEDQDALDFSGFTFDQVVTGTSGEDTLSGGQGANYIDGGGGNDLIRGKNGADVILGGDGDDKISSSGGDDILVGGLGMDMLSGGSGRDRFIFTSVEESPVGEGRDVISDFTKGEDKIDLSRIDAIAGGADDDFVFIASNPFTAAGQLRSFEFGRGTVIEGDTDGDGRADFQIELTTPKLVLTADDFLA